MPLSKVVIGENPQFFLTQDIAPSHSKRGTKNDIFATWHSTLRMVLILSRLTSNRPSMESYEELSLRNYRESMCELQILRSRLCKLMKAAWNLKAIDDRSNLVISMPARCKRVIDVDGGHLLN